MLSVHTYRCQAPHGTRLRKNAKDLKAGRRFSKRLSIQCVSLLVGYVGEQWSYLCKECNFASEIKRVRENYPDARGFKLAYVIHHGLQRFIVKNSATESTGSNDLSHVLKTWVCCVK